jgi:hypothetical protein
MAFSTSLPLASLSNRDLWILLALLFAFGVAVAVFLIGPHNNLPGRGGPQNLPIRSLGEKPILQIELSWKDAQLSAILLKGYASRNVADARVGNVFDTFLFIPTYSMFLLVMGLLLARGDAHPSAGLFWITLALVSLIAAADWCENAGIERALTHFEAQQAPDAGDALRISNPSVVKWVLLGVLLAGLGSVGFWRVTAGGRVLALASALLGMGVLFQLVMYFRERSFP